MPASGGFGRLLQSRENRDLGAELKLGARTWGLNSSLVCAVVEDRTSVGAGGIRKLSGLAV